MALWTVGLKVAMLATRFTTTALMKTLTSTAERRLIIMTLLMLISVLIIVAGLVILALHLTLMLLPLPPPPPRRRGRGVPRGRQPGPLLQQPLIRPAVAVFGTHQLRHRFVGAPNVPLGYNVLQQQQQAERTPLEYDQAPPERAESGLDTRRGLPLIFDLVMAFFTLIGSLAGVLVTIGSNLMALLITLAPTFGFLFAIFLSTAALSYNSQPVMSALHDVEIGFVRPIVDYILEPIATLILFVWQLIFAGWLTLNRVTKFLTMGPARLLFQCTFGLIPDIVMGLGQFAINLIWALAYFIANNPLKTGIPLQATVQSLTNVVSLVWVQGITCACSVLNYVIGGLGKNLNDPMFSLAIDLLGNAVYSLPVELLLRPLTFQERPSINNTYTYLWQGSTALGYWLQNTTTCQVDIWIYNGNGTLIRMVNGSLPMPTDDLKYLVRVLQSDYVVFAITAFFIFTVTPIAQAMYIVLLADWWFVPAGRTIVWNFDWYRQIMLQSINALGTIIDTAGTCSKSPQFLTEIPYGQLTAGLAVVVWFLQVIADIAVGEFYTTFVDTPSQPFFYFAGLYLLGDPHLQELQWEIIEFANATGCTVAQLDGALGVATAGLAQAIVYYLPLVPLQIISFVRVLLVEGDVDILDSVSTTGFEQALLQTSEVGQFWFQFQKDASEKTCAQGITFFCSLGVFSERALSGFFRLVILAVHMLIWLLKVIIGSIQTNQLSNARVPDFDPALFDLYAAGCRLGMTLALVIPLDMPCLTGKRDFCVVSEFPGTVENTPSICLATTACKVGNLLVVPLDLLFTALKLVTSLQLSASPLLIAVRQVLNVIIFRVLSPICPLAHFFDCIFDLIFQTGVSQETTPATSFFCLITGALVFLVQTVGEVILQWVDFFITVIVGLLDGVTGDIGSWLLEVLKKFFTLLGGSLVTIGEAILNFILSVFMGLVVGICWAVNVIIFFSITDKCQDLEKAVQDILGGSSQDFFSPAYINYKKRADGTYEVVKESTAATMKKKRTQSGCGAMNTQFFANVLFARLHSRVPSFTTERVDADTLFVNPDDTCLGTDEQGMPRVKRTDEPARNESVLARMLRQQFGTMPSDPELIPTYLANRVFWDPTSECATLFKLVNGTRSSDLAISDQLKIAECVKLKTEEIVLRSFTLFHWLPEGTLYNPMLRLMVMVMQFARFALVAFNWIMDRVVPTKTLLSIQYQQRWANMQLDVSQYATLSDAAQPDLEVTLPATEMRVTAALEQLTLQSYLRRNFPSLYDKSRPYQDPILDSINKTFSFVADFTGRIVDDMYNQTVRDTSVFANYTNSSNYWGNLDYGNRSALLSEFGPDVMRAADVRFQTLGMYNTLAAILTAIITWVRGGSAVGGATPYDQFRDMLIDWGNSIPTLTKRSIETPFAVYDQWDSLKTQARDNGKQRTRSFYDSPAFVRSPTVLASLMAGLGDLYVRATEMHPNERVPPWCAIKAAQLWNITYVEARDRLNVSDCQNITLWQITKQESQNVFERTRDVFRPRTAQAAAARETLWNLGADVSNSLWRASYVFMGGDRTEDSFTKRVQDWSLEIKNDREFKRPLDYYSPKRLLQNKQRGEKQPMTALAQERKRERDRMRMGFDERNVLNSDFLSWQKLHGSSLRDLHAIVLGNIKTYLAKTERLERQHQENFRMRLRVEARQHLRKQNLHLLATKEEFERMVDERVAINSIISPIFNNSFLSEKQCSNLTSSFCEECYFLAVLIDTVVDRVTYFVLYYTDFFIFVAAELVDTLRYSFDNLAPVRTGRDGQQPPYFPVLGQPAGLMFQWSNAEINNGIPSLTLWLEQMIGGKLPSWLTNGPCNQQLNAYIAARAAGGPTFVPNVAEEFYDFVQNTVGIPICQYQDTAIFLATDRSEDIALYAFDHLLQCSYLSEIDCSQQMYSFSGGLFVTLVWIGAPITVLTIVFPTLALMIVPAGALVGVVFHAVITYNWSAWCAWVPPQCEPIQVFRFVTLTAIPKCSPWIGGFITNSTYSNTTCYDPQKQWDFARCTDSFQNMFDNLAYFKLWWGTDFGLTDFFGPIYATLFGTDAPTNTFPGWNTRPEKFRVYGSCGLLTFIPWLAIGAAATLLAGCVILAVLSQVAVVFAILCIFISNILRYMVFALADIYNMVEESVDPPEEEEEEEDEMVVVDEEQANAPEDDEEVAAQ